MKKLFFFCYCSLFFFSCQSVVEIPLPEPEKLAVVNATFSPDSVFKVHLSYNKSITSNASFELINNASVEVKDEYGNLFNLTNIGNGFYKANFKPQQSVQYSLNVMLNDGKKVESQNAIPDIIPVESVDTSSVFKFSTKYRRFTIKFADNSNADNYYGFRIWRKVVIKRYNEDTVLISQDTLAERVFFDSEDFYFDDQFRNIANEAVIEDDLFNGRSIFINLDVNLDQLILPFDTIPFPNAFIVKPINTEIHLMSLSKDYYMYTKTINLARQTNNDPFGQPVQIFNNINRGRGIFAGYGVSLYVFNF
jgi:hypothetical protein